jgi:hypothetical protein
MIIELSSIVSKIFRPLDHSEIRISRCFMKHECTVSLLSCTGILPMDFGAGLGGRWCRIRLFRKALKLFGHVWPNWFRPVLKTRTQTGSCRAVYMGLLSLWSA